ncbi:hypothetical protein C6P44_002231 [Monosporozyma unispora]|nr:hypothetical protein C6P44_002231 [Kazachstania unispora]
MSSSSASMKNNSILRLENITSNETLKKKVNIDKLTIIKKKEENINKKLNEAFQTLLGYSMPTSPTNANYEQFTEIELQKVQKLDESNWEAYIFSGIDVNQLRKRDKLKNHSKSIKNKVKFWHQESK